MSSQKAWPKQMTLLRLGATLSSPQLEQAKGRGLFPQSGQLVELIVQKNFSVPLASRSAPRLQRVATTSPRSAIAAVGVIQVGTNSGATLNMFRNKVLVCAERPPRLRSLAALRSIAIATRNCALMMV